MGVTTTILLPAGRLTKSAATHVGVSNGLEAKAFGNAACYEFAREHPREFLFAANEVPDVEGATAEIEKYLKLGAVMIAEQKFGVECDSPAMQKIYALAQVYRMPVLMHWQFQMYNYGFERFYRVLEKYPRVNFIGHAQTWWANVDQNHRDQAVLYPKGDDHAGRVDRALTCRLPEHVWGSLRRLRFEYPHARRNLHAGILRPPPEQADVWQRLQ